MNKFLLISLFVISHLEACVTVNTGSSTYTVDSSGSIGFKNLNK